MEAANKIGILGGTFNPIHMGHLILAQSAHETLDLQQVLFIPCATPAHKSNSMLLDAKHRQAMIELAIQDDYRFELCDIELARGGTSYAIDTVRELTERYPGAELYFIIGADTLTELHSWKDVYSLLPLCRFVTFARPGSDLENLHLSQIGLDPPWPTRLLSDLQTGKHIDISSSDIRHRAAEGMSIRYLVPQLVEMYIAEHRLYGE